MARANLTTYVYTRDDILPGTGKIRVHSVAVQDRHPRATEDCAVAEVHFDRSSRAPRPGELVDVWWDHGTPYAVAPPRVQPTVTWIHRDGAA